MNKFILLSLLFITSCGFNVSFDEAITLSELQGGYSGCQVYAPLPSFFERYDIELSTSSLVVDLNITNAFDDTCETSILNIVQTYEIIRGTRSPVNINEVDIDLKVLNIVMTLHTPVQVGRDYCGITDWAIGEQRDITGLTCPDLLVEDPFHSAMRQSQSLEFMRIIESDSNLLFPTNVFLESGDTSDQRKISGLLLLSNI